MKKTLTIFTPTFNRAFCLDNLYQSLMHQTNQDFLWLIIDDGSTDNSKQLINSWQVENKIEIQYIYQQNQGMHGAHNTAYQNISTELNTCIDSDDFMPKTAVDAILTCWKTNKNQHIAGIVGLDINTKNELIGTQFESNLTETTLSGFYERGGKGDKKVVYRTDIVNKYPEYPIFEGEKYVSLAYKYLLIDQDYKLLILNKPLVIVEYLAEGSSLNMINQYVKNPKGFAFIRKINMQYKNNYSRKFIECIHYVSSSIMTNNYKFINESPLKIATIFAIPFGIILFFYIQFKTRNYAK
jgi:glycosyltransferase involved in cell wall biosynthesis